MLFSGAVFLIYFLPIFFGVYYALAPRFRNAFALFGSLIFYAWGAPKFVFVLIASAFLDYVLVKQFSNSKRKKNALKAALIQNIGLLFFFKYFNFFQENVEFIFNVIGFQYHAWLNVALPLGISFFTFQKVSFVVDVYRGEAQPPKFFSDYLLFVLLFPQLIAGPILKYKWIEKQLQFRHVGASWNDRFQGVFRFVFGLSKKLLIADQLAPIVNSGFAQNAEFGFQWLALFAFAIQLYFDFSGYSDMAIGLGKMMDFSFPENFNLPYKSKSIREFWRKWHITLGQWIRDYLYIPLGGNRVSDQRHYLNLFIVFVLSGLWHGASFNFLLWGLWHGVFIALETRFRKARILSNWFYAFVVLTLGWILFRTGTLSQAIYFLEGLLEGFNLSQVSSLQWFILLLSVFFALLPNAIDRKWLLWQKSMSKSAIWSKGFAILFLACLCLGALATSGTQPFIYFRF